MWHCISVSEVISKVKNWLSIPEVANLLGISPGKVNRLIEERSLFVVMRDGQKSIPAELIVDGEPLHSLRGTLILLADLGFSENEAIEWLYTESDVLGQTPLQSLLEGKKSPVRRLAQMTEL